jgi:TonB-linked SusC/RagA family outer membrane protein
MKYLLVCLATTSIFSLCLSQPTFAGKNYFDQQPATDSIPAKRIDKVNIVVKDLMDGESLDSVYVIVGGKRGYTDANGFLSFDSVAAGATVYVSKSGYVEQSKKAKPDLALRMGKKQPSTSLKEFTNGVYQRPFEHFSGAATVVSGAELRKINSQNFAEALKYYAPSLIATRDNKYGDDPNVSPSVKIRGAYNFPASATIASHTGVAPTGVQIDPSAGDFVASGVTDPDQPVILLNGVQVALQTAMDLDMNHIERVLILKDAAATSQYGVRGGNGVVLIQTRQPQKGAFNITYSGQVQTASADLSSYNVLDASGKLKLEQAAGLFTNNPSLYESRLYQVNKGVNTDWLAVPARTAVGTKHYLSLDGGDDDISYGLNFSFNDQQGVMKGSQRKTSNFGGFVSTRIKNTVVSNYLTYTKVDAANSPYGSFADYARQNPYWTPYDSTSGLIAKVLEQYTYQGNTVKFYNPAYNGTLSTSDERAYSRINNLTHIDWTIGNGFKLNGRFSITKQSDEVNVFLPPDHTMYADYSPNDFFRKGKYKQTSSDFLSMEGGLNLHYTKKKDRHLFYASAGVSAMETRSESVGLEVAGFVSNKLSDIAFGNAYSTQRPQTGKMISRLTSGYGNFTYSFDNRYQLEVTGNADESSQFGKNNLIAPHWSVGGSWNLHQENFFHANNIVSQARLRGSVGAAGNQFFQSYLGNTFYNYYTDKQYVQAGSTLGTRGIGLGAFLKGFANDDLRAPETQKLNIGIDAVLLQNRLFVKADVYRNTTKDLVLPIISPASTGFLHFNYYDNLGAIENRGIELDMNYAIIQNSSKKILWTVRVNGIHNEDRIISTSAYLDSFNKSNNAKSVDQTRPQPRYVNGQSLSGIWAVRSLGIDPATGKEKFLKADGSQTFTWDAADKAFAGDLSPTWQGSFGSSVTIKNISAGIYFNYQVGASYYNQTLADRLENADMAYNVDARAAANRWQSPGDAASYKALSVNGMVTSPTYATTRFVEKADLLNCSAITIDYSLPQNIAGKIKAKNAKLGLMANNAFQSGGVKAEKGIYYPFRRLYTFSLTTSF